MALTTCKVSWGSGSCLQPPPAMFPIDPHPDLLATFANSEVKSEKTTFFLMTCSYYFPTYLTTGAELNLAESF